MLLYPEVHMNVECPRRHLDDRPTSQVVNWWVEPDGRLMGEWDCSHPDCPERTIPRELRVVATRASSDPDTLLH